MFPVFQIFAFSSDYSNKLSLFLIKLPQNYIPPYPQTQFKTFLYIYFPKTFPISKCLTFGCIYVALTDVGWFALILEGLALSHDEFC